MAIRDDSIQMWFDKAFFLKKPLMIPFLTFCARKGKIERLEENICYYQLDLCVDMINLMIKDGYNVSCYNVSFKFDYKIKSEMKSFFASFTVKAKSIRLQQVQQKIKAKIKTWQKNPTLPFIIPPTFPSYSKIFIVFVQKWIKTSIKCYLFFVY